ncbi:hypothetical protein ACIQZD_22125 [Peribacillus sp. NPDC096447]|uniref:hypothetical protein n=1 Tax=Peribacillus sp. NPDC096447 TaxID=3364394 RepID=UPI0037F80427
MKWGKQDWFWLTGILIIINISVFAFRLSDNQTFMEIFSFMVNGISIALAFVAMYTSFKQNSDNQTLTTQMSETLARMDEKINSMGQKVSEFSSVEEVKKMLDARLNIAAESIEETLSDEDGNISKSEVIDILNNELSNFSESLDKIIKNNLPQDKVVEPLKSGNTSDFNIRRPRGLMLETIKTEYGFIEFTLKEIQKKISDKHNEVIPLTLLRLLLIDQVNSKYLVQIEAPRDTEGKLVGVRKFKVNEKIREKIDVVKNKSEENLKIHTEKST